MHFSKARIAMLVGFWFIWRGLRDDVIQLKAAQDKFLRSRTDYPEERLMVESSKLLLQETKKNRGIMPAVKPDFIMLQRGEVSRKT